MQNAKDVVKPLNQNKMFENKIFELTDKDGFKVLAEYKGGIGWFDLEGYQLNEGCWVWCEEIK